MYLSFKIKNKHIVSKLINIIKVSIYQILYRNYNVRLLIVAIFYNLFFINCIFINVLIINLKGVD